MKVKDWSPWGSIQHLKKHGESGIVSVSTAGHGGIYVPPELVGKIPEEWRKDAARWSGSENWYEEDCNWAYVAASLPEHFEDHDRLFAISSIIGDDKARDILQSHFPDSVTWYYEFLKVNGKKLRKGGGGTHAEGKLWYQRAQSLDGTMDYSWLEDWRGVATVEALGKIPPIFTIAEYEHLMVPGSLQTNPVTQAA